MLQLRNNQALYAGIGITLALIVSVLLAVNLHAESGKQFRRGAWSAETKSAIHAAFEDNDYGAYTAVMTGRQFMLTEDEFSRQVRRIAERQEIQDAFAADDHDAYRRLTDGSIRQLSEAAFHKKSRMLALKEEIRTALNDRSYTSFMQKRQELKELLGDEYVNRKRRGDSEEMTEERFNALAERAERHGEQGFGERKRRGRRSGHRR